MQATIRSIPPRMTQALKIDAPAYLRRLEEAGADRRLAEAIVWCFNAIDTSELATKADLAALEAKLKSALRTELRATAAELKSEILKWMFGAMAVQMALFVSLAKVI